MTTEEAKERASSPAAEPPPAAATSAAPARGAAAAKAPRAGAAATKCEYYLERKRRCCRFEAIPGKRYCGNHLHAALGEGEARVPCPYDPTHPQQGAALLQGGECRRAQRGLWGRAGQAGWGWGVCGGQGATRAGQARRDGAGSRARRPWRGEEPPPLGAAAARRDRRRATGRASSIARAPAASAAAQDVNAGLAAAAAALPEAPPEPADGAGRGDGARARRPALAAALGEERFMALVARVEAACAQVCPREEAPSVLAPAELLAPGSDRMAAQQASILGNMAAAGLLADAERRVFVEMGAGKGYLSLALAERCPATRLVLVDVQSCFKNKADRGLRARALRRLRCDLKDFWPGGVRELAGGAPWVALGKHLCGAATDHALRCCGAALAGGRAPRRERQEPQERRQQAPAAQERQERQQQQQGGESGQRRGGEGERAAPPAGEAGLRGLAIATCCHHRCSWQHYVGQPLFRALGFSPEEFELVSWMTGWALCGHEVPAGCGREEGAEQQDTAEACSCGTAACAAAAARSGQAGAGQQPALRAGQPAPVGVDGGAAGPWRPHHALARRERVRIGGLCKRLVDAGRLAWLRGQAGVASAKCVAYVPPALSGENRLLLAAAAAAPP
eukprot:scaffold1.g5730.t1